MVHVPEEFDTTLVGEWIAGLDGITEVYDKPMAVRKLELPDDRIGDLVILSGRDVVIGRTPSYHDLAAVATGLRSHGGRYEEMVPLLVSKPLVPEYVRLAAADPRNFDVFDFTINGSVR